MFKRHLTDGLDRLPSFSATWTVDREIAPDLGFAEEYQKTVQARIDQMTNDADKKRAAESLEGAVAFIRKGTKVAMKVELDYFGKNKFHILHTFYDTNPPSVYEYFANNDGLVYIVEAREKKSGLLKIFRRYSGPWVVESHSCILMNIGARSQPRRWSLKRLRRWC